MVQADPIRSLEVRLTVPAKVGAKAHTLNSTGHEEVNTAEPQAMRYPAPKVQADRRPDGRRRITSYNVCYTKLLRSPGSGPGRILADPSACGVPGEAAREPEGAG